MVPVLGHKFRAQGRCYIYDASTSNILEVDPVIYGIVDDGSPVTHSAPSGSWRSYGAAETQRALAEISDLRRTGGLSPTRPRRLVPPACGECLRELLGCRLQQLILCVSESCNLRCKYCSYSGRYFYERRHSSAVMSESIGKRAIRLFWERSRRSPKVDICFYGGEPLTQFGRIVDLVTYARSIGQWSELRFHIDTNGTLLDEDTMRYVADNRVFLQISLDGPKEAHDRWRVSQSGAGSFDRVMDNLAFLRKLDSTYFETMVGFASTQAPPYDLEAADCFFAREFPEHLVRPVFVQTRDTSFFQDYAQDMPPSLLAPTYKRLALRYIDARVRGQEPTNYQKGLWDSRLIDMHRRCGAGRSEEEYPANGICVPGNRRLFVTTDGRFYPCEKMGAAYCIGDITSGLDEAAIINLIDDYVTGSTPDCTRCWALRLCGMCFASARKGGRLDFDRKREACDDERWSLANDLVIYTTIMAQNPGAFDFVRDVVFE